MRVAYGCAFRLSCPKATLHAQLSTLNSQPPLQSPHSDFRRTVIPRIPARRLPLGDRGVLGQRRHRQRRVPVLPVAAAALLGPRERLGDPGRGLRGAPPRALLRRSRSLFDKPGGAYLYTRAAFGDFVGFEVGWMTWIARIASVASLSVGFARAVGYLWAGANHGWGQALAIFLALARPDAGSTSVGVKSGARTAVFLAFGKTVPLLLFVAVGLFAFDWSRVFPVRGARPGQPRRGRAPPALRLRRLREHVGAGGGVQEPASATCRSRSSPRS